MWQTNDVELDNQDVVLEVKDGTIGHDTELGE